MRKSAIFKILIIIVATACLLASCSSKPENSKPGRTAVENERLPIKPRIIKIEDEYPHFDYSISMPIVEKTEGRSRDEFSTATAEQFTAGLLCLRVRARSRR